MSGFRQGITVAGVPLGDLTDKFADGKTTDRSLQVETRYKGVDTGKNFKTARVTGTVGYCDVKRQDGSDHVSTPRFSPERHPVFRVLMSNGPKRVPDWKLIASGDIVLCRRPHRSVTGVVWLTGCPCRCDA